MGLSLFTIGGFLFLLRYLHVFAGLIWIGTLYYFNFMQGAFFAETDATTKSNATQKLLPRALWWFRYGALWTFITGLAQIAITGQQGGMGQFSSAYGEIILTGMLLATIMFLNVWLVIWPNQKVVIENAVLTAQGKPGHANAAACAGKAGLASRTNTLFSIPMLYLMVGARHFPMILSDSPNFMLYWILVGVIVAALEFNALKGKTGPITTIKGVISCGFGLTVVLYAIMEICR